MTYSLFIDDERFPPDSDGRDWIIARDWDDVQAVIREHGMPDFISFDHDLGDHTHSGHEIIKFIIELDMDGDPVFCIPADFEFYVHSQNPIGKANITGYIQSYMRSKFTT
jgi:hypothetical protein